MKTKSFVKLLLLLHSPFWHFKQISNNGINGSIDWRRYSMHLESLSGESTCLMVWRDCKACMIYVLIVWLNINFYGFHDHLYLIIQIHLINVIMKSNKEYRSMSHSSSSRPGRTDPLLYILKQWIFVDRCNFLKILQKSIKWEKSAQM